VTGICPPRRNPPLQSRNILLNDANRRIPHALRTGPKARPEAQRPPNEPLADQPAEAAKSAAPREAAGPPGLQVAVAGLAFILGKTPASFQSDWEVPALAALTQGVTRLAPLGLAGFSGATRPSGKPDGRAGVRPGRCRWWPGVNRQSRRKRPTGQSRVCPARSSRGSVFRPISLHHLLPMGFEGHLVLGQYPSPGGLAPHHRRRTVIQARPASPTLGEHAGQGAPAHPRPGGSQCRRLLSSMGRRLAATIGGLVGGQ